MKEEINYHAFADFLISKMTSTHSDIEKDTAAAVLSNWIGRFYFRHSSPAITLHELQEFNPIGLEANHQVLRCLLKNGMVKRIPVHNQTKKHRYFYYSLTNKLYSLKNEYVSIYEQEWSEYERWSQYFKTYQENEKFFDEIDAFFKVKIPYKCKIYEKAFQIKSEYFGKIASELSYEKRIELKNKALLKIDGLL